MVWCLVDPEQVVLKDETMHILAMNYLYTIRYTFINYPKEFIQCGTAPGAVQFAGPIDDISLLTDPKMEWNVYNMTTCVKVNRLAIWQGINKCLFKVNSLIECKTSLRILYPNTVE